MTVTYTNLKITSSGGGGGSIDTTAWETSDLQNGSTSSASATFNTDGTGTLFGSGGGLPASPKWYSTLTPPNIWMEYAITSTGGVSTVIGGLTAGTRYQLNTPRDLGIEKNALGVANKQFTISFYDASSGGTLLGQKTLDCSVEVA